jgi:porin
MCGRVFRWIGIAFLVFMPAAPGLAGDDPSEDQDAWTSLSHLPDDLRQLTDFGGERSKLEQAGLQFTFTYYGDAFANPTGGGLQGPGYDGRFATIVDADLAKLVSWSGATFHTSFQEIFGTQFSATHLDNLMNVSGIETPPSSRLFNLWLGQDFGSQLNLRVGQFTAAQEFVISDSANLFVNSTFGWPALNGVDMPSGGPNYPEATPGARIEYTPNRQVTLRAAVFDGNPAGPGSDNPVARDPFGVAFRVNDPPFFIAEFTYAYDNGEPGVTRENANQEDTGASQQPSAAADQPNAIKFGAWLNTGPFADERYNSQGGLLAVSGTPLQHSGDYAAYGIVDVELWNDRTPADRNLSVFVRATAAPSDRNEIDRYIDGGATFKGPLVARPDDTIGLGLAVGRISPLASAYDRDIIAVAGMPMPVRNFEAALELTYQWMLAKSWFVQPDLQYVVHPGGNIINPLDPQSASAIPNALVFGLRSYLRF